MRQSIRTGVRHWPWALAAVAAGAVAGAGTAWVLRRVDGPDRPEAVDPTELRAVVDHPQDDAEPHD